MRNNFIRLGILGTLIILCIWQTTILWLGDTSSHNFLGDTSGDVVTQPKEIWVNKSGLAYKIDGDNDQGRLGLLIELVSEMKKGQYKIASEDQYTYAQLLARQGFVYEYGLSLSLDEILGFTINKENSKKEMDKISEIFIDISESDSYRNYIYLINEKQKVTAKVTLEGRLELHNKTIKHYNDENKIEGVKTYQASLLNTNYSLFSNYSNAFLKNVFYPLDNQNLPIPYKELYIKPIITGKTEAEQINQLESYINVFFKNPLYKDYSITPDGIVFSDSLNLNIRYSNEGVLEFKKLITGDTIKLSAVEKMNKINNFIAESEAIPEQLKKGLYLKQIVEDEKSGETIYRFGYRYEDFEVLLTDHVKTELKTNEFLELAIKSNQIVRGSWLMLELEMINKDVASYKELTREVKGAINDTLQLCNISDLEADPLDYIECAYIIQSVESKIDFDWASLFEDEWYFP